MPWGKTEFWIMLENFGFEWIFLEPSRWKWLNMEIFKLSFSNWLLRDKELRGNTEIEGENDQRISAFAKCNVKLSCCQYFPTWAQQTIKQFIKLIKVSELWRDNYYHHAHWSGHQLKDHKTSKACTLHLSEVWPELLGKSYNFWLQFAWLWWFQPWDWSCIVLSSLMLDGQQWCPAHHHHHYLPSLTPPAPSHHHLHTRNTTLENSLRHQHMIV